MDPVSITASAIAFAGLVVTSVQAAYKAIDGLAEAPQAIVSAKTLLAGTQDSLNTLTSTLTATRDTQAKFGSVLRLIDLGKTLKTTEELCNTFKSKITEYTKHSTDSRFSNRDKITVHIHESEITRFNNQLRGCQTTISLVIETVTLIVTGSISDDVGDLSTRFQAQEQALSALATDFAEQSTALKAMGDAIEDKQAILERFATLQHTCEATRKATQAQRTGQTFGDLQIDQSHAMQGIAGEVANDVDQSFGRLTAQNNSKAFQGQMDAASFARMFG